MPPGRLAQPPLFPGAAPSIIAHRANDAGAVERALALGVDAIELDVRRDGRGRLVVSHDLPRDGARPRPLADALAQAAGRAAVHLDLKEEGYEAEVAELALAHLASEQLVFTTLEDGSVAALKRSVPHLRAALTLGRPEPERWLATRLSEAFPRRRIRGCGADAVAAAYQLERALVLRRLRVRRVPLLVWTVNDERRLRRLLVAGRVGAVVTDRPELALRLRRGGYLAGS